MSYLSLHPNMGCHAQAASPRDVLAQKETVFHAVLLAVASAMEQHNIQLGNALSYAALEYRDAVAYALDTPTLRDENDEKNTPPQPECAVC